MTTNWNTNELATIAAKDEITIAPRRPDGTLARATTIWVVTVGDDLVVRSYRGAAGAWYQAAIRSHTGHLRAGDIDRDVTFADYETDAGAVDDAYHAKYGRSSYVDAMVAPDAAATTLRVLPR
jgi:hypothetical protein